MSVRVTVWNEYLHEINEPKIAAIYPEGIHGCIAGFLKEAGHQVKTAVLSDPEHGLSQDILDSTEVLIWWGHMAHGQVEDAVVERVYRRVMDGMGLILLHASYAAKIMQRLCNTEPGRIRWRESGEQEILWVIDPTHPITSGLNDYFIIPHEEMYGEPFGIPKPDELLFISWFEGGEVFRSGVTYRRGKGKIFYFRPGHEEFPVYRQPEIQKVIKNAVQWATPNPKMPERKSGQIAEPIIPLRFNV